MSKFIESLIHPSKKETRTVNCFGIDYVFSQVEKGRFVAKVEDQAAIDAFLALPKAYREYVGAPIAGSVSASASLSASSAPPETPKAGVGNDAEKERIKAEARAEAEARAAAAKPKDDTPKAPPKAPEGDASETANEATRQAQALLASTPQAIKRQLEKKAPGLDVLNAAIALEEKEAKPRKLILDALRGYASALKPE